MVPFRPVFVIFGFITLTGSFLIPCKEGCKSSNSPSSDTRAEHLARNVHLHTHHGHHHYELNTTKLHTHVTHTHKLHGHNHVTFAPLTTSKPTESSSAGTTTPLCDNGCTLVLHPEGWNFCHCPVKGTTSPPSSSETATNTPTQTNNPTDITTNNLMMSSTNTQSSKTTHTPSVLLTILSSTHAPTQYQTTTKPPTSTTKSTTTTQDICDILCSLQQGGDACNCSKPGLPG